MRALLRAVVIAAGLGGAPAAAGAFPITVESCGRPVTVSTPPRRAVSYGSNLTEMMMALNLTDRMAGFIGQGSRLRTTAADLFPQISRLRELQSRYPTRELFLEEKVDFYFAGWSYGMRAGGETTPDTLGRLGIPVYELTESCIRIGRRVRPTLDYLYRDLINLGRIFGVEDRAAALVAGYRARIDAVARRAADGKDRPRVFLLDSAGRVAGTAGGYAMPTALIEAAGGRNIADDLVGNWTRIDWETVIERDPDAIVVLDFGGADTSQKLAYMRSRPALRDMRALKENRVLVLGYDDLTPGPRNVSAVERIAEFLHDDR